MCLGRRVKMKFISNVVEFDNDLSEVVRLFYDDYDNSQDEIKVTADVVDKKYVISVSINEKVFNYSFNEREAKKELHKKRYFKRAIKKAIYLALSEKTQISLPWGCLTGVRPTKLVYELLPEKKSIIQVRSELMKEYFVCEKKARLATEVVKNQKSIIKNDKLINLYVNIPFCPTRCVYCSFISSEVSRCEKFIPQYVESLIKEIREMKKLLLDKCYIVSSIYIGGGTPTTLNCEQLEAVLSELAYDVREFTVECGRPDTITKEKLDILKKYGVTRISINPQTFSDRTLKLIGRGHTKKQVFDAYALAMNYDFDVNMDFIAGLPKESLRTFKKNIDTALMLAPNNITVHTLAIKKGSILAQNYTGQESNDISKMLEYAFTKIQDAGYVPYYMYRLKNMLGSFENVGFCEKGKACKFNIDSMEETGSILAVGAGGISKRIYFNEERIERCANVKDISGYISRLDEMIERKKELFS